MGFGNSNFISNMADVLPQLFVGVLMFVVSLTVASLFKRCDAHKTFSICGKKH